jgi:preprotein translocase subunit SecA
LVAETDYTSDEKTKSVALTDEGVSKIEEWTGIGNIYDIDHVVDAHQINQALRAHVHYLKDEEYIVVDGEVIIVDEFTGRTMPGRRWSDGLHQAVEAKEGVKVKQENKTLATITFQNFFRIYRKLAGMTGTALTEAEEFHKIYKLEVVPVPTNRPMIREDGADVIFRSEDAKFSAVVDEIEAAHKEGQPVLVGTTSIEKSERLSRLLEKRGIVHEVLNAKQHEKEASIVAGAGQTGAVTIATNMAGRGTDIVLGPGVTDVGGLYIIGTERHESRRIDNQLRGRAGRQGDPGETRFFLSFDDDVMRVFGGDRMQGLMERFHIDEDVPIESRLVTRQIEGAQSRVEGYNFDARRHVVEYDDVMNKQREIIYGERRKILEGTDTRANLLDFVRRVLEAEVPTFCPSRHHDEWDLEGLWERIQQLAPMHAGEEVDLTSLGEEPEQIIETLVAEFLAFYEEREKKYGATALRQAEQELMLQVIDVKWRDYLTQMEHLREGVGLAGYAQIDPLVEYKQQAYGAFQELIVDIEQEIVRVLMQIEIQVVEPQAEGVPSATATEMAPRPGRADVGGGMSPQSPPPARPAAAAANAALARVSQRTAVTNVVEHSGSGEHASGVAGPPSAKKLGRNELCWCGSGKKFKKCHGA